MRNETSPPRKRRGTSPAAKAKTARGHTPPVLGLVGGIGSGKSLLADQFASLGCAVVDADRLARRYLREPAVRRALAKRFGKKILDASGRVDREALGRLVFSDRKALEALNSLTHPELCKRTRRAVQAARRRRVPAVVLDAPLLLEKGLDTLCDHVVYINVPKQVRLARVRVERGWGPGEVARREGAQVSLKTKRQRADYVIDNSLSPKHALKQVRILLARIGKP